MNASGAYRVRRKRGAPGPAVLAAPSRIDQVELVELASGESVLFWEGPAVEAKRLVKALRRDLRSLDARTFRAAWLEDAPDSRTADPSRGRPS